MLRVVSWPRLVVLLIAPALLGADGVSRTERAFPHYQHMYSEIYNQTDPSFMNTECTKIKSSSSQFLATVLNLTSQCVNFSNQTKGEHSNTSTTTRTTHNGESPRNQPREGGRAKVAVVLRGESFRGSSLQHESRSCTAHGFARQAFILEHHLRLFSFLYANDFDVDVFGVTRLCSGSEGSSPIDAANLLSSFYRKYLRSPILVMTDVVYNASVPRDASQINQSRQELAAVYLVQHYLRKIGHCHKQYYEMVFLLRWDLKVLPDDPIYFPPCILQAPAPLTSFDLSYLAKDRDRALMIPGSQLAAWTCKMHTAGRKLGGGRWCGWDKCTGEFRGGQAEIHYTSAFANFHSSCLGMSVKSHPKSASGIVKQHGLFGAKITSTQSDVRSWTPLNFTSETLGFVLDTALLLARNNATFAELRVTHFNRTESNGSFSLPPVCVPDTCSFIKYHKMALRVGQ